MQVSACRALWYGSFKSASGQLVLVRDPDSARPYDLGIFTLDTKASPEAAAERYSWRWPIDRPKSQRPAQITCGTLTSETAAA